MKILLMYPPPPDHLSALRAAAPGGTFEIAENEATAREAIGDAEVVLGNRYFLQCLPRARRLRWLQSGSVGVDLILRGAGEGLREVTLTCARGVYDDEVAEHALALLLGVARGLHLARDAQRDRRWPRWSLPTVSGRSCLVLGWGGVAKGIARRLRALGVKVQAARRRHEGPPILDDGCPVHGPATWRGVLRDTQLLLMALPLTDETQGLVAREELDQLPEGAIIVNVGRGGTLDEQALLDSLKSGRLCGAGIDALADEPPARSHGAWREERLLLTPHVARSLETCNHRWQALFVENLARYASGRPLRNVVDQRAGY